MTPDRIDALEQEQIRAALARLRGRLPMGLDEDELMDGYKIMVGEAKCAGDGCKIRNQCDRFARPAVDGQRWLVPMYGPVATWMNDGSLLVQPGKPSCSDYVPIPMPAHGGAVEEGDGA